MAVEIPQWPSKEVLALNDDASLAENFIVDIFKLVKFVRVTNEHDFNFLSPSKAKVLRESTITKLKLTQDRTVVSPDTRALIDALINQLNDNRETVTSNHQVMLHALRYKLMELSAQYNFQINQSKTIFALVDYIKSESGVELDTSALIRTIQEAFKKNKTLN